MLQIAKKAMIFVAVLSLTFGIAYASSPEYAQGNAENTFNPLIDSLSFESSRFSQPADDRIIAEEDFIDITNDDDLKLENDHLALYLNEETLGMKILNKNNNFVWSTAIDDADAGTYTSLLTSGIGFDYINMTQNFTLRQNIGLTDTQFNVEMAQEDQTLKFDVSVDGFCTTRNCRRFYDQYLEGRFTLEEMIEFGYTELGLGFSFEVTLTDDGIEFYLPLESITTEDSELYQLSSIIVFPGLGGTYMDETPGYMIIPDGVGALIRYEDNEGKYVTPYESNYYGPDFGLTESPNGLNRYGLSLLIFGAVHVVKQNAFLGIVESGVTAAKLNAFPNGARNVDYNLIYNRFVIKQVYRQSFTSDGSASALRLFQSSYEDIAVSYQFLDGNDADYVGVAKAYQQRLIDDGVIGETNEDRGQIPIHLQYLMSDSRSRFIGKELVEMSTVSDVDEMYDFFIEEGLLNQRVSLLGWNDGGFSGELPSKVDLENKLGSTKEYRALFEKIEEENDVLLVNNYLLGSNATDGLSYGQDVAESIDRSKLAWSCEFCVYTSTYLLYPEYAYTEAVRALPDYQDLGVEVMFGSVGSYLFSYYDRGIKTRDDALLYYQSLIDVYQGYAEYMRPNAYAFRGIDAYYQMPVYNNQYNFFDDLVPLLPIILSGYVEMYSDQMNYNSQGEQFLLMLIDFNIYPTYGLTKERPSKLTGTDAENFFSSEFDAWKNTIVEEYEYINEPLSNVIGETVVSRFVPEYGVSVVEYSNGVEIIVNYSQDSITYDGVTVPQLSYFVRGE